MSIFHKRLAITLVTVYLLIVFVGRIVVVTTPSIDKTILIKTKGEALLKGDYVMYNLKSKLVGDVKISKKIGCVEREKISVINRHIYCNGDFLGAAKTESKKGDKLNVFTNKDLIIPDGYVYIMGTHKDSFDSRYFGLVEKNKLKKLIPII